VYTAQEGSPDPGLDFLYRMGRQETLGAFKDELGRVSGRREF
jgi:hypothetical protein